mmetsp:Transcript_13492/g.40955  ORF Transcript_13492/g.40955 Transcript_13492/m.40955 type:complete len:81 (-) Transcript_13492:1715-1957(-)|eukprot:scaffold154333_cov36-Tisochrysis_lutea.AAC.4
MEICTHPYYEELREIAVARNGVRGRHMQATRRKSRSMHSSYNLSFVSSVQTKPRLKHAHRYVNSVDGQVAEERDAFNNEE